MDQDKINKMLLERIEVIETEIKDIREAAAAAAPKVETKPGETMADFMKIFGGPTGEAPPAPVKPKEPPATAWFRGLLYDQPLGNVISFGDFGTWTLKERNGERYFLWEYKWLVGGSQVIGSMYDPRTAIQPEIFKIFHDKFGGAGFKWENVEPVSMALNTGVSAFNFSVCKESQKKRKKGAPSREDILGY